MVGPHGDEEDVEVPLVRYQCKPVSDYGNTIRNKTIIKNNISARHNMRKEATRIK